jgi:hypothetical protein
MSLPQGHVVRGNVERLISPKAAVQMSTLAKR